MMKKIISISLAVLVAALFMSCSKKPADSAASGSENGGSVMLYSSLKEAQLEALKAGFTAKYPHIKMDYYAAGTSKVTTKMAAEKQSGQIACDVVWIGDPSNYITFKRQGILEQYVSPEAANIDASFKDADNYYCGGRMIVMGLVYNTNNVTTESAPKTWDDLLNAEFKNQIVMTDPGEAGTTFYAVAGVMADSHYGIDFFKKLKAMGTVYPEKDLIAISSPIALIKNSANQENGKLLYDFILSPEGQQILVDHNVSPIRFDVSKPGAMSTSDIVARSMKIDNEKIADQSADILAAFDAIFK